MNYRVLTERLTGVTKGQTITGKDLLGYNVQALIDAGHLEPVATAPNGPVAKPIPEKEND